MGLQINNGVQLENSIINNLYNKVQGYTSNFLNTDTRDFADYLKTNYDSIDENNDSVLSQKEIVAATARDIRNEELKKLLDNNSIEKLTANIDTNNDGQITYNETDPSSNVNNILKSSLREIQTTQNMGQAALNLAQNMCKNYYASPAMTSLATSAINCLL